MFPEPFQTDYLRFQKQFEPLLTKTASQLPQSPLFKEVKRTLLLPGKRLRPFLCYLSYRALGGRSTKIFRVCLALELFHTFCLLQDDAMDESVKRRGRQTTFATYAARHRKAKWKKKSPAFGKNVAFLSGDLAFSLAHKVLATLAIPEPQRTNLFKCLSQMEQEVLEGQFLDILFSVRQELKAAEIRRMLILKSGRYTIVRPMQIGIALTGKTRSLATLCAFGDPLGLAFQIRDDELSLFGNHTGKGTQEDIQEGKKTLLLYYTLKKATRAERVELEKMLYSHVTQGEVQRFRALVKRYAWDTIAQEKENLLQEALQALPQLAFSSSYEQKFLALGNFLVKRTR